MAHSLRRWPTFSLRTLLIAAALTGPVTIGVLWVQHWMSLTTYTIDGVFTYSDGASLGGTVVRLRFVRDGGVIDATTTRADGSYNFSVRAHPDEVRTGKYFLEVDKPRVTFVKHIHSQQERFLFRLPNHYPSPR